MFIGSLLGALLLNDAQVSIASSIKGHVFKSNVNKGKIMTIVKVESELVLRAHEKDNTYLHDEAFAPVDKEITATELDVIGEIPKELDGVYIRNGHNPIHQPPSGRYHWFDGDSMVHATAFKDGNATYRNRMVQTAGLLNEMEAGKGLYPGLRDGFEAESGLKNNAGTDVVLHNGEFKAMFSRCGQPYRLDPETLQTLGADDFGGDWPKGVSAHSKVDERTGEFIFFTYSFNSKPYMEYGVVSADNKLICSTEIELSGPRLPHDSWITENYTILHDLPMYWDPELLKIGKKKLIYNTDLPSRYGVIPRYGKGSEIVWFDADPTYMLHTVNAWEEGDEIVAYGFKQLTPVPEIEKGTPSPQIQNFFLSFKYMTPRLTEFRFNLKTGKCEERIIDETCAEMPGMNNRYLGIKSQYVYNTLAAETPLFLMSGIQKFDLQAHKELDRYNLPEGKYMGQPVFAPNKNSTIEDDGYLMAYVIDGTEAEVYIWHGQRIGEGPVARVQLPQRIPGGSHAYFGNGEDIRKAQAKREITM